MKFLSDKEKDREVYFYHEAKDGYFVPYPPEEQVRQELSNFDEGYVPQGWKRLPRKNWKEYYVLIGYLYQPWRYRLFGLDEMRLRLFTTKLKWPWVRLVERDKLRADFEEQDKIFEHDEPQKQALARMRKRYLPLD